MANRMLRDWTQSDKINNISVHAERFFVRLIMKVDDYGCFYADHRLLKANLFPLLESVRTADISRWLDECHKAGLIVCYNAEGKRYLQIKDFRQRLDRAKSKFPLPIDNKAVNERREIVNECPPEVEIEVEVEPEVEIESGAQKKVFSKPTLDEVFAEMQDPVESEKFFNYYESNGWRVGKNPMKNWVAAAKNWLKNATHYAANRGINGGSPAKAGTSDARIEALGKW